MTTATHLIEGDVLKVSKGGTLVGTRKTVNLIEGSNVTLTVADNSGSDRVDVTVAASASGVSEAAIEGALTNVLFGSASINLNAAGGEVQVNGTKVLGARGAAVADATGAGDIIAQFNALLARCRAHGLIAP